MHIPFSILLTTLIPAFATLTVTTTACGYANEEPFQGALGGDSSRTVSVKLFMELEELARLVDISYCVGNTGVWKPFRCASRCNDFPGYELVDVRFSFLDLRLTSAPASSIRSCQ